jgi:hypothetical protein
LIFGPPLLHTLQLVLKDSIFDQQYISSIIAICRSIAGYFNGNSHAAFKLNQIQKQFNAPEHKLVQDVETRFNSQYYMLERMNEQKASVMAYSFQHDSDNKVSHLDSKQWQILSKIVKILKPFEEITKKLSARNSLSSCIIPSIVVLKYVFKKAEEDGHFTGMGTCIAGWKDSCERRFQQYLENKDLITATFLGRKYKDKFFD